MDGATILVKRSINKQLPHSPGSLLTAVFLTLLLSFALPVWSQPPPGARGGRGGRGGPPASPKAAAAIDMTGYWVSLVTEDWKFRMVTAKKGNFAGVPLNAEGRRAVNEWDPAKDEAAGQQCKAYGAAGLMRLPGRLHITWENDATLRIETDAGTQTRLFHFGGAAPQSMEASWQGYSAAQWEYAATSSARTGNLKVVTTHLLPGYLRKNGVPYSGNAVVTEYYDLIPAPNGDQWLVVSTEVNDPQYLNMPFITSTHFKKLADATGWDPQPCSAR